VKLGHVVGQTRGYRETYNLSTECFARNTNFFAKVNNQAVTDKGQVFRVDFCDEVDATSEVFIHFDFN